LNKLTTTERVQVVAALREGNSIRSVARMTGIARNTIAKLLVDLGEACTKYQHEHLRNLSCRRLEADEIWSFVCAKQKNVAFDCEGELGVGDVWTFTAIDADTKLVPSWLVGPRDVGTATEFMRDLAGRLASRVQLTTDGLKAYLYAVEDAFGADIDFAQLNKIYAARHIGAGRYSPPICAVAKKVPVNGNPDRRHVSTCYVERQNLTMRMSMRRLTRLTNAFSKKLENHCAAIALYFMHYNFARVHQTLRVTPAMAAGVSDHVWEIGEIVALLDAPSAVAHAN
jgi:IS1 family transposase